MSLGSACCKGSIDVAGDQPLAGKQIELVPGVQTYVSLPPQCPVDSSSPQTEEKRQLLEQRGKTAVVIATDIFGIPLINTLLIADKFAAAGYVAVVPDLFNGDPVSYKSDLFRELDDDWDDGQGEAPAAGAGSSLWHKIRFYSVIVPWFIRHHPTKTIPLMDRVCRAVKETYGVQRIGIQGYCYGGKVGILLARSGHEDVDAVCVAHPSAVSFPEDIEAASAKPVLYLIPEFDDQVPPNKLTVLKTIVSKQREDVEKTGGSTSRAASEVVLFEGMSHGFAVRGNEKREKVRDARERAFEQALAFFDRLNFSG